MYPTEYPEVNEILDALLSKIKSIFSEKLVGVYLYGSLVTGDFNLKVSDIDLVAALSSDVDDREFEELKKMHQDFVETHPLWNDRIEVQYLLVEALKTFKTKDSRAAVISPGEPFHFKDIGKHWLMNWYIVREKGITLFGPNPKDIIEPITKEEFIESVKDHTRNWNEWVLDMRSRYAQSYAILTLCRALYAYKNGDQVSKIKAANWVKQELPEWKPLIENALKWREEGKDPIPDDINFPETQKFIAFIVDRVK